MTNFSRNMTNSWKQRVLAWMEVHRSEMEAVYADLHARAEVSWEERQTTAYVVRQLKGIGLDVRSFPQHTGAVAVWDSGRPGRTIALRADMDALWQCVNEEWRANHSCGHDAHMTMVLSAVRCLKEIGYEPLSGKIMAVFQPAEEVAQGALTLSRAGVLDGVDGLIGIHLRPIKEMAFGQAASAIYHGGVVRLKGIVRGRQAHAARPEDGINVIDALAAIVQGIHHWQHASAHAGSCQVTKVHVPNESDNIVPDYLEFVMDLRAATNDALSRSTEQLSALVREAGSENGAAVEIEILSRSVPAMPDHVMEKIVGEAIAEVLGADGLAAPVVTPGAEDFHYYRQERPSLHATMIGLGSGLAPGLHHPDMSFRLEALCHGAAIMALSVMKLLGKTGSIPEETGPIMDIERNMAK